MAEYDRTANDTDVSIKRYGSYLTIVPSIIFIITEHSIKHLKYILKVKTLCDKPLFIPVVVRLGAEGSNSGKLMVRDGINNHWLEVCTDNWNSTLSRITCQQLGYL